MSEIGSPPSDNGKMMAMLSYGGVLFGLPLGVIPMLQRDDPYALRHGKTAVAVCIGIWVSYFLVGIIYSIITTVTCGFGAILFPILFIPGLWGLVTGLHGLMLTNGGTWDEPMGGFGIGEKLFGSLTVNENPKLPPSGRPPPPPPG